MMIHARITDLTNSIAQEFYFELMLFIFSYSQHYNKKYCNSTPAITEAAVVTIPGNIKL